MGEMKPITGRIVESQETQTMKVVLPSGTEVLSTDFYSLALAHPIVIEIPTEALAPIDNA